MTRPKYYAFLLAFLLAGIAAVAAAQEVGFHDDFSTLDKKLWFVSNGWSNGAHQSCEWRADAISTEGGKLVFTVSDRGGKVRPIGCAEMHRNDLTSYGIYETRIRTAAGSGLNTAFFTFIGTPYGVPTHDEIDFEFLGKNPHTVDINYFANDKPHGETIRLGFDASQAFHDYAFEWMPSAIKWFIDGVKVYETPKGAPIPSHPGHLFLSLWTGSSIEDSWMGHFTYTKPVTAEFASVKFTPNK